MRELQLLHFVIFHDHAFILGDASVHGDPNGGHMLAEQKSLAAFTVGLEMATINVQCVFQALSTCLTFAFKHPLNMVDLENPIMK